MQFNQIKETALYVNDLDQTELFYKGKLGLEVISKVHGRHIFFRAGYSILLCFIAESTKEGKDLPEHYGEGKIHMAFEVPKQNYEIAKRWIEELDISIEHEHHWHDDYYSFYFRDPDGHSLEIVPEGMWDKSS